MSFVRINKIICFLVVACLFLNACNGKFPGADARKFPADPKKRVKKILRKDGGSHLIKLLEVVNVVEHLILQAQMNCGEHL